MATQQVLEGIAIHEAAKKRLLASITRTESYQNEIMKQLMSTVIVDKLVWPKTLLFSLSGYYSKGVSLIGLPITENSSINWYTVNRHALGQIADVSGITRLYLSRLYDAEETWKKELLDHNLNTLMEKSEFSGKNGKPKRFLIRIVGDQIRGFLSQHYNRKLTTVPTLRTFVETCREYHAGPVDICRTDIRFMIKYMLPMVFEPVDGELVAFGASYTNSDFGAGRLQIGGVVMRIGSGHQTLSVLTDKYSRTHLGPIIQESDIELSQETDDKELAAAQSAIRDIVTHMLSQQSIEDNIKAIQLAHEKEIPWYQLKNKLKDLLSQQEVNYLEFMLNGTAPTLDLPPIKQDTATAWWAANAVSSFAEKELDPDRRADLQNMAGQLIAG